MGLFDTIRDDQWKPTLELRWREHVCGNKPTLEQKWIAEGVGAEEWREIPTHEGCFCDLPAHYPKRTEIPGI